MKTSQIVNYFISLLVICNPLSALPALLNMTHGQSIEEKRNTGIIAGLAVGVILIIVTWIGQEILNVLGIRIPAFQLAGGFVVLLIALSMLRAETSRIKQTTEDQKEARARESIAIVPLAMPLMAGPGAISTVIVATNDYPGVINKVYLSFCAIILAAAMGLLLYFASGIEKMLGTTGINIVNRLGGLVLASIGVEYIAKGALGLFPGWGGHM